MGKLEPFIVLDNGSDTLKAGFGSEDDPRSVFEPIVKVPDLSKPYYEIGDEAATSVRKMHYINPIKYGIIVDFINMERIWHYTFYKELFVAPEDYSLIVTENILSPKAMRERTMAIMFDTFKVKAIAFVTSSVLSMYASGKIDGIAVTIGLETFSSVAVFKGYVSPSTAFVEKIGGSHIEQYFSTLFVARRNVDFMTKAEKADVYVARTFCEVSYDAVLPKERFKEHEHWNGSITLIGNERFEAAELLFDPSLFSQTSTVTPLDTTVLKTLDRCDKDQRPKMLQNILLAGGASMYPGLAQRLQNEIVAKVSVKTKVCVTAPPERKYSAWNGGSILSTLPCADYFVTKEMYQKNGNKCSQRYFL